MAFAALLGAYMMPGPLEHVDTRLFGGHIGALRHGDAATALYMTRIFSMPESDH